MKTTWWILSAALALILLRNFYDLPPKVAPTSAENSLQSWVAPEKASPKMSFEKEPEETSPADVEDVTGFEPGELVASLPSRFDVLREVAEGDFHGAPPSLGKAVQKLDQLMRDSQHNPQRALLGFEAFKRCALNLDLMPSLSAHCYFHAVNLEAEVLRQPEILRELKAQLNMETLELVQRYETL